MRTGLILTTFVAAQTYVSGAGGIAQRPMQQINEYTNNGSVAQVREPAAVPQVRDPAAVAQKARDFVDSINGQILELQARPYLTPQETARLSTLQQYKSTYERNALQAELAAQKLHSAETVNSAETINSAPLGTPMAHIKPVPSEMNNTVGQVIPQEPIRNYAIVFSNDSQAVTSDVSTDEASQSEDGHAERISIGGIQNISIEREPFSLTIDGKKIELFIPVEDDVEEMSTASEGIVEEEKSGMQHDDEVTNSSDESEAASADENETTTADEADAAIDEDEASTNAEVVPAEIETSPEDQGSTTDAEMPAESEISTKETADDDDSSAGEADSEEATDPTTDNEGTDGEVPTALGEDETTDEESE